MTLWMLLHLTLRMLLHWTFELSWLDFPLKNWNEVFPNLKFSQKSRLHFSVRGLSSMKLRQRFKPASSRWEHHFASIHRTFVHLFEMNSTVVNFQSTFIAERFQTFHTLYPSFSCIFPTLKSNSSSGNENDVQASSSNLCVFGKTFKNHP